MGALAPTVLESVGTSTPIRVSEPVGARCAHAPVFLGGISRFKYIALRLAPQPFAGSSAIAPPTFSTFRQAWHVFYNYLDVYNIFRQPCFN